jgi:hypothetical protein
LPPIDLTHALVLTPADADGPQTAALHLLLDEAARRTGAQWQTRTYSAHAAAQACSPCIVIGREDQLRAASFAAPAPPWPAALHRPEAFRIDSLRVDSRHIDALHGGTILRVAGRDDRGMLFAIGYLLRHIDFAPSRATLPAPLHIVTAPRLSVRGHQLGYRFKNILTTPGRPAVSSNTSAILPSSAPTPSSCCHPKPTTHHRVRSSRCRPWRP